MKVAYVDTSVIAAILFDEPGASAMARKLASVDVVISSLLLEAELRAAAAREGVGIDDAQLQHITWITPQQPMTAQLKQVLGAGALRGASLFHVASALYFFGDVENAVFLSLDVAQRKIAEALGFVTEWTALGSSVTKAAIRFQLAGSQSTMSASPSG